MYPDANETPADTDGSVSTGAESRRIREEIARPSGTDPFAAAVRATRMPMVISDPRRQDNPIIFANESFCRLVGYRREEILGRNCRFLQGKDTDPKTVQRIHDAVVQVAPVEVDIRNYRKDGVAFWNRLLMAPVFDEAGKLAYFFASQVDVTLERERLEGLETHNAALLAELSDRLRAQAISDTRLTLATHAAKLGVWELELDSGALSASAVFYECFGRDNNSAFGYADMLSAIHPDDRERLIRAIEISARTGAEYDIECRVVRATGDMGCLQLRAQRVDSPAPLGPRMAGICMDVTARRTAEHRLELSEESLRLTTEAAEIGTWDLDMTADILSWSARTRAMFGMPPGVPATMADFYGCLHPDDLAATSVAFARAIDPAVRATYDVEYRTIGKSDGVIRWVAAKGRGLFDQHGNCVRALGTAIDITVRKAEAGRQAFLLNLVDTLRGLSQPGEILQAAMSALGQHLRVSRTTYGHVHEGAAGGTVEWMPGYAESGDHLSGVQDAAALPDNVAGLLRRGERAACADVGKLADSDRAFWARLRTRSFIAAPLLHGHRMSGFLFVGHTAPRLWSVSETLLVGDVAARIWDSMARARAEAALRVANTSLERQVAERTAALQTSQARMRAVFETSYQLQELLDLEGCLLDANATSLAVVGTTLPEIVGRPFWECPWFTATPGASETVRDAVRRAAGGADMRMELNIHVLSGLRSYDFSIRPIRDEASEVVAILTEAMDITDRRLAEAQLRQSQKMEAVGQLTGGIAHDFNNLLTGIVGSLELLQRRVTENRQDGVLRYAAAATASAQRAAALTQRLLAFARRQPLDPRSIDANALVTGMEDLLRRTLGPAIRLDRVLDAALWPVLSDPHQLENAVLNLAINARDAMPEGGRLVIETSNTQLDTAYAATEGGDVRPGSYVLLSVTDSGIGMTPEIIAKAFDPFFTTKPIGEGTGLGLSMLYGFIKQSSGHVRIYSEPGRGTTFKLYLPRDLTGAQGEAGEAEYHPEPMRAQKGETVLVVEDEAIVRMLVTETLDELGYTALEAQDGLAGLAILQSDARVDLLVTDVGLPGLNGRQLADAARSLRPGLRVLFMTGYAHNAAIGQGAPLESGTEIISKPFALDALATRIRGMIEA